MCEYKFLVPGASTVLFFAVLLLIALILTPAVQAQAQTKCDELLKNAEEQYRIGRFPEAIAMLNECLAEPDIPKEKKTAAHRLRALAFMSQNLESEAKNAVRKLLELVPDYSPDPSRDKPTFIKLVEEVKQERLSLEAVKEEETPRVEPIPRTEREPEDLSEIIPEKKDGSAKKWLIIGGVGVVGAVVGVLALGGGGGGNGADIPPTPDPLGRPPVLPDRD